MRKTNVAILSHFIFLSLFYRHLFPCYEINTRRDLRGVTTVSGRNLVFIAIIVCSLILM